MSCTLDPQLSKFDIFAELLKDSLGMLSCRIFLRQSAHPDVGHVCPRREEAPADTMMHLEPQQTEIPADPCSNGITATSCLR